jgi:uncharacterized protein (DUF305 family)
LLSKGSLQAGAGAVGATLALLLSGCSDVGTETAEHDHGTHEHESASQPAHHNAADATFARDMIPHHEQAIVMSDIVLAKQGIDPRVTELASQIKAAQGPEIATMTQWLAQWGAPAASEHEGHDMGGDHAAMGMMTDDQLEQLRRAQGVDASRQFLTGMIAHHEGAVAMAQTEVDTGQAQEAVHLAHEIIETQQREIDTMKGILGAL